MTTSQTRSFLTEVIEGTPIPVVTLEYFRARLQSRLHQIVLDEWLRQEDRGLSQAELARRVGRKPEVVNRLLGSPGNWTLNTVSDLLLGMGAEPEVLLAYLPDKSAYQTLLVSGEARLGAQPKEPEVKINTEPEDIPPITRQPAATIPPAGSPTQP